MEKLDNKYLTHLENIKSGIQSSEILSRYLEDEEEEVYNELRAHFEPQIDELHAKVASENPLQLIDFEEQLLDDGFEGLYLSRVLGYCVLRGEINTFVKYSRPQDHFKNVLLKVCNSSNFDLIKLRIGQSIQVGFALSSDIWITNLIDEVVNKKVKLFLANHKLLKYRDQKIRWSGFVKFRRQFESLNYHTAEFPNSATSLKILADSLKTFLVYRADKGFDNASLLPHIKQFIENKDLRTESSYIQLMIVIGKSIPLDDETGKSFMAAMDDLRENYPNLNDAYFEELSSLFDAGIASSPNASKLIGPYISRSQSDELSKYYDLMDTIHLKGYVHDDAIEATRLYYDGHQGLSVQNQCLRDVIIAYFENFVKNIGVDNYQDYFEINKTFIAYISIFSNQEFNQSIKQMSLSYVKKLLKRYTDKRGKDYQDIKKFVKATFSDLGFMKDKELVELFKTKRKKPTS